jgi:hypothetical protein
VKIEPDGGGKQMLAAPQQHWRDPNGEDGSIMQTALFAGHRMMAITDDAGGFELGYLNFKAGGFKTMSAAKDAAPEFAKRVLARMTDMIAD